MLRRFLSLLYLCPCLDLGLFMSYLCDIFFIFIFIFILINGMNTDTLVLLPIFQNMTLLILLIFYLFFRILFLDDNVDEECK